MANDIFIKMCSISPVQKEWKPKSPLDKDHWALRKDYPGFAVNPDPKANCIWLPRQEDWQDIYLKFKWDKHRTHIGILVEDFIPYIKREWENHIGTWIYECNTNVFWCLFVHKEVYGLVWDWDKNVWRKE
jgi:hypothetical protein